MSRIIFVPFLIAGLIFTCMPVIFKSMSVIFKSTPLDFYDNNGEIISEFISNLGIFFYVIAGMIAGTAILKKNDLSK